MLDQLDTIPANEARRYVGLLVPSDNQDVILQSVADVFRREPIFTLPLPSAILVPPLK